MRALLRSSVVVSVCSLLTAQGCGGPAEEAQMGAGTAGVPASGTGGTSSPATGGTGGRGGAASGGSAGRGGSSSGGSSTSTGGSGGSTRMEEAGAGGEGGVERTGEGGSENIPKGGAGGAVPSGDGYPEVPPPVCYALGNYPCDGDRRVECAAPGEVISFDPARDATCPVCAPPPAGSRSCEQSQREYREFLTATISAGCANSCDADVDCAAWEITNSCGSVALSLDASIDEEPIGLAEEFAATRCGECGEVTQTMTLRRAGSPQLEADPSSAGLLDAFGPRCVMHQCVLAPR